MDPRACWKGEGRLLFCVGSGILWGRERSDRGGQYGFCPRTAFFQFLMERGGLGSERMAFGGAPVEVRALGPDKREWGWGHREGQMKIARPHHAPRGSGG